MTNMVISWSSTNINNIFGKSKTCFYLQLKCILWLYFPPSSRDSSCGIFWLYRVFMAAIWGNILVNYLTYILGLTFQNLIFLFKKRVSTQAVLYYCWCMQILYKFQDFWAIRLWHRRFEIFTGSGWLNILNLKLLKILSCLCYWPLWLI